MTKCPKCGKRKLRYAEVHIGGTVKGKAYTVSMPGLSCPNCSYGTIRGNDSAEFGRRLADKHRSEIGLLTSDQIRQSRERLGLTQEDLARRSDISIASIKRYEWGKVQEPLQGAYGRTCFGEAFGL